MLADAGMLKVIRTRRVRAIDERFYGRTARIFYVGAIRPEQARTLTNYLSVAATESGPAHEADDLRAIHRHARIPRERAAEFWERIFQLTHEFTGLPRSRRDGLRVRRGALPHRLPHLARTGRRPRNRDTAGVILAASQRGGGHRPKSTRRTRGIPVRRSTEGQL